MKFHLSFILRASSFPVFARLCLSLGASPRYVTRRHASAWGINLTSNGLANNTTMLKMLFSGEQFTATHMLVASCASVRRCRGMCKSLL